MSHKKVLMSVTTSAIVASAFVATEEVSAASYKVEQGDTLWKIAQQNNVTVADLKKWNNLKSDIIVPNQIIRVVADQKANTNVAKVSHGKSNDRTYTVKSGDTLSEIALKHGVSVKDLMKWNNLNSTLIFPGNEFVLSEQQNDAKDIYFVRAGDTLLQIALDYDVSVEDLVKWNNLESANRIYVNQKLIINNTTPKETPTVSKPVTSAPVVEKEVVTEAPVVEEQVVTEAPVVEEQVVTEAPVVEEQIVTEAPVVEEQVVTETPVVEDEVVTEAPVVEEQVVTETPVVEDEVVTEAPVVEEQVVTETPVVEDEVVTEAPVVEEQVVTETPVAGPTQNEEYYIVQSGDNIWSIAQKVGSTLQKVADRNGISQNKILQIGDKIIVDKQATTKPVEVTPEKPVTPVTPKPVTPKPATPKPTAPKPAAPTQVAGPTANEVYYVVKSGDNIWSIAQNVGSSQQKIAERNGISTNKVLQIGDKLIIDKQANNTGSTGQVKPTAPKPATPKPTAPKPAAPKPATPNTNAGFSVNKLISSANSVIGTKYVWGGQTKAGFDCSGFIHWAYNDAGKQMGRTSTDGYFNRSYYVDKPQVGDLVFFKNTYRQGISHMGIYVGNGQFIHAGTSTGVTVSSVNDPYYWGKHFDSYKRLY